MKSGVSSFRVSVQSGGYLEDYRIPAVLCNVSSTSSTSDARGVHGEFLASRHHFVMWSTCFDEIQKQRAGFAESNADVKNHREIKKDVVSPLVLLSLWYGISLFSSFFPLVIIFVGYASSSQMSLGDIYGHQGLF